MNSQFGCVGVAGAHILVLNVIPAAVHIKPIGRLTYSNIRNGSRRERNAAYYLGMQSDGLRWQRKRQRLNNRIVVDGLWVLHYIAFESEAGALGMFLEPWVQCGIDYLGVAKALR